MPTALPNQSSGNIDPSQKVDSLLDHQTQRLEDIANNAVDFIRINLLVLGVFAPFLAAVIGERLDPSSVLLTDYIKLSIVSWLLSTLLASGIYRRARSRSTSQFGLLEQAIVNDWSSTDLRDEIIDNSSEYERMVSRLMLVMAIGIGLSLSAILFLALAVADSYISISSDAKSASYAIVLVFGLLTGLGVEILRVGRSLPSLLWAQTLAIPWSSDSIERIRIEGPVSAVEYRGVNGGEPQTIVNYISSQENLSQIRARLLNAIFQTMGSRPWNYSELQQGLKENEAEIGLTRDMISRLVDDGYLRILGASGPETFIIHTRRQEIINGEDLDKNVGDEIGRVIGHINESEKIREAASDALGVEESEVEDYLVAGNTSDRINKLNEVVDNIQEHYPELFSEKRYGMIEFRNRAEQIQLTPKGIRSFALFQIERAKISVREDALIQALVLANRGLEEFFQCLLLNEVPEEDMIKRYSFAQLLDLISQKNLITEAESDRLNRLRIIRNQAVHESSKRVDEQEVVDLIDIAESVILEHS